MRFRILAVGSIILKLFTLMLAVILVAPSIGIANKVPEVQKVPESAFNVQTVPPGRLWNLQDADILSVINEVSQETGKNFVVDPRVSGKVTLISSKPLRQSEVYDVFLSVLSLLGYAAIPSGDVVRIVPNMESGEM